MRRAARPFGPARRAVRGRPNGARSNTAPKRARMSRRRGEAEASTIRLRASQRGLAHRIERQHAHALDVVGLREHVDGLDRFEAERARGQRSQVPRQRPQGRTRRRRPGRAGEAMSASSVPGRHPARGRVEHDRVEALGGQLREHVLGPRLTQARCWPRLQRSHERPRGPTPTPRPQSRGGRAAQRGRRTSRPRRRRRPRSRSRSAGALLGHTRPAAPPCAC